MVKRYFIFVNVNNGLENKWMQRTDEWSTSWLEVLSTNREQVSSGVKDPFVQRVEVIVVREDQIEILECATEEMRRVDVELNGGRLVDAFDAGETTFGVGVRDVEAAVFLNGHCQLPGRFAVLLIIGQAPHDEVGLGHFVAIQGTEMVSLQQSCTAHRVPVGLQNPIQSTQILTTYLVT